MKTEMAARVIAAARERRLILTTAESCTGGLLAGMLTAVPGASACFERGYIVYADSAKSQILGIDPALIDRHGAVSSEIALRMAEGALACSAADVAVAVTGVAGPSSSGDSPAKPVGTVYIAAMPGALVQRHFFAGRGRDEVRAASVAAALALFMEALAGL